MISRRTLIARYAAFAVVATAINLAGQWLTLRAYGGAGRLAAAMAVGTGAGLAAKYLLDKRWIFFDREAGLAAHGRKFTLYTLMGVATTALFWSTELVFHALGEGASMKYVGAVVGLTIGYLVKYRLDRRYVFRGAAA